MSLDAYTRKFRALVQKSEFSDSYFLYLWYIAGLNPGARRAVTDWATDRKASNLNVGLGEMMRRLISNEEMSVTQVSLAGRGYGNPDGNSDLEPMDVGAVATLPHPRQ